MNLVMLLAGVVGYHAHKLREPTERFANGWGSLARRVIGVVMVYPFAKALYHKAGGVDGEAFTVGYWLAYLPFGIGNALGWWWQK